MRASIGWCAAAILVLLAGALLRLADAALIDTAHWTGWAMVLAFLLLAAQGLRALKMWWPASTALLAHLHLGWITALLFLVHAGGFPDGGFHRIQWLSFTILLASGAIGFCCERLGAHRQRDWDALPYPRIAEERAVLQAEAEAVFHKIVGRGGSPLMANLYARRLLPFLSRPAHLWQHWFGSRRPFEQISLELDYVGDELGEDPDFGRLREIINRKTHLDERRALYWLQRGWLFVHVPAAAISAVFIVLHIMLVAVLGG